MRGSTRPLTHAAWRTVVLLALLAAAGPMGRIPVAAETRPPGSYSGWRGGIGIAFGTPSRDIADITEMGYEIIWGGEDPRAVRALDLSIFRYWNSIVETSLKGAGYDFSALADKDEAARLAFDAWMERAYGVKGLSQYAKVRYNPKGSYGDVYGSMDLSSENKLVRAVVASYLGWFEKNGVTHGGIGLDNAGKVPRAFLEVLSRRLNAKGLGIAANGCPDEYLSFIDFFGNEGFPFSVGFARQARAKGLRGILGEFTMQNLSSGELQAYLSSKLFNGIVFFGYTNGGTAAGAQYSFYCGRPDIYEHQRWVFRRFVPLSRAMQQAGRQEEPGAVIVAAVRTAGAAPGAASPGAQTNAEGKVLEREHRDAGLERITGRSPATPPALVRYGKGAAGGVYLFVDSGNPEEVACDARQLGIRKDTLVFDELAERLVAARRSGGALRFRTQAGPTVLQLGSRATLAASRLARVEGSLEQQMVQRRWDRERGARYPEKAWSRFCQGGKPDLATARSGRASLRVEGKAYAGVMPQWRYFNRQGAAQLVRLEQKAAEPLLLTVHSKAENVERSDELELNDPATRKRHFDAREGHTYSAHLYLDYQDGKWPEVHTVTFSAGTHDWEEKSIRVSPTRPVKTALVLLEFHQPQGTAWFDDLALTQASKPEENLLASAGFEEDDPAAARALILAGEYEKRLASFQQALGAARRAPGAAGRAAGLERDAEALAEWIRAQGVAPYYARELRDLDAARHDLALCRRILSGEPEGAPLRKRPA